MSYTYDLNCDHCAKFATAGHKLLKCSRCKTNTYCNEECQKADWKRHKKFRNEKLPMFKVYNLYRWMFLIHVAVAFDRNPHPHTASRLQSDPQGSVRKSFLADRNRSQLRHLRRLRILLAHSHLTVGWIDE